MKRKTTDQFIKEAKLIHGNKYDYSLVDYINNYTKIKIICPKHGIFEQLPSNHLKGVGCSKCANNENKTKEEFIKEANLIYNNFYNYSLVNYINNKTKVKIICPKHGVFVQAPKSHLKYGCKKCFFEKTRFSQNEYIEKAKEIHDDKYDYSLVDYKNIRGKIKIICPIHGVFEQLANNHLRGIGCPKCKSSKGEITIRKYLKKRNILFEEQKKFDNLKDIKQLSYDFYIPEKNLLIEFNGEQHYRKCFNRDLHKWHRQKHHDWLKRKFARDNHFNLLVIKYDEDANKMLDNVFNWFIIF